MITNKLLLEQIDLERYNNRIEHLVAKHKKKKTIAEASRDALTNQKMIYADYDICHFRPQDAKPDPDIGEPLDHNEDCRQIPKEFANKYKDLSFEDFKDLIKKNSFLQAKMQVCENCLLLYIEPKKIQQADFHPSTQLEMLVFRDKCRRKIPKMKLHVSPYNKNYVSPYKDKDIIDREQREAVQERRAQSENLKRREHKVHKSGRVAESHLANNITKAYNDTNKIRSSQTLNSADNEEEISEAKYAEDYIEEPVDPSQTSAPSNRHPTRKPTSPNPPSDAANPNRYKGIKSRVKYLNAEYKIRSQVAQGTPVASAVDYTLVGEKVVGSAQNPQIYAKNDIKLGLMDGKEIKRVAKVQTEENEKLVKNVLCSMARIC